MNMRRFPKMHVFDANALIAWLRNEPGADEVRKLLLTSPICMAHAINYCEVFYDMIRVEGEEAAQKAMDDLQEVGVTYRDDMNITLCQTAGHIKAVFKRVSLADCFAMALAKQEGATLVTSDHHEFDPLVDKGICKIQFFR
ncbi:MAG: type II toxin-antitoxin system VapC family toxin [Candidatus Parabeggiatoa sp. nov. 3]|nr:MAG: type II toxin-antitoxin system VapC family toxin [Gammaproteobacteria bacterium]RKZ64109.1 MAG: type II toxin-antitoxin system VapC family toxin [Gammaproteobacteria bacterium]RKZ79165.1 MAG: type II toxin-antitoxin system VapC family toxin [Gammaproteobacteria bacterium]HEW91739.1 type II toxin-antitoxin system VapC family toxin [Thermotogaceae bacterium]